MNIPGQVTLKQGKEFSVKRFHPWIFSGAIDHMSGDIRDGSWVEIQQKNGHVLGYGHYQHGSISIRILSFGNTKPTSTFWHSRIEQALLLRKTLSLPSAETDSFRLIHGEGDGLPGLIVDYYNGCAVVQAHSAGMHCDRHLITDALKETLGGSLNSVYYKSQGTQPAKIKDERSDEYLFGVAATPHVIKEYDRQFYVDWEEGQKTGFFLDQRENRKLLAAFCHNKRVLNTFCYTGGFSVFALSAGATLVHSVDSSEKAIDLTRKNISLNGFDPKLHECLAEDTFEFLKERHGNYDVIILDPPAFAKHRDARHQAVKGYQRLNAEAFRIIRPGGIVFTFSCSQVVDRKLFYDTVVSSALQSGRQVSVLYRLTQPPDHPVSMYHPEGEYLKGLVLYVE
jgi:23S rRNA (cytosine1962-C5)-methyltransferase